MAKRGKYLCMVLASLFAFSAIFISVGMQDAKAQSLEDALKRIEALEARSTGNVSAPNISGIKIGLEIRTRFEQQVQFPIDTGATAAANRTTTDGVYTLTTPANSTKGTGDSHVGVREDNEYVVQRVRLSFDADVNKNVRAYVRVADNRVFGGWQSTTGGANATNADNEIDLNEGYVDLRNLGDLSPILENINARIGRWQMFYGDHRLIGHLGWTNQGRSWDGARIRWDNKKGSWIDLFATSVQEDSTGAVSGNAPSRSTNLDELFWGVYSHFQNPFGVEGILAEPYVIVRDRARDVKDSLAGEDRWTGGVRIVGDKIPSLPGVDFKAEQAWQWGETKAGSSHASETIQAFAGAWGAGYTCSNVPWSPRIGYQYAIASGDDRPGAGSAKTFDQLYPTGHARLGYIDLHGWMNIRAHKIEFSAKPSKKLVLKTDLWFFEADEEVDNWYSVAGGTNRIGGDNFIHVDGRTGSIDDEYGQELDLTANYKLFENFGVVAGYSHYFTGDFMEDTNNGLDRDADWFYLQTTLKF
jgi:hypothetical protein